jgi:hypothetical protein
MSRVHHADRVRQIPLGLEPRSNPSSESALRAAYRRTELPRRLSFEQAMSDGACAIGIRNLALATARRLERRRRH